MNDLHIIIDALGFITICVLVYLNHNLENINRYYKAIIETYEDNPNIFLQDWVDFSLEKITKKPPAITAAKPKPRSQTKPKAKRRVRDKK